MNVPFSIADKRRMKGIKLITDILNDNDDIRLCIHSNACTTKICMLKKNTYSKGYDETGKLVCNLVEF